MDRIPPRTAATPPRLFTVQCGFASYFSNTVVVEAADVDAACRLAVEIANQSDGWKAIDHCGPTFVDAVAEGEDADPWMIRGSVLPVPAELAEQDGSSLRSALIGLLDWAALMGGWEAEAWRVAERSVGRNRDDVDPGADLGA